MPVGANNPGSAQRDPAAWSLALGSFDLNSEGHSRVAAGSAGVADIVQTMQFQPWLTIEDKEARLRAMAGAFHANQAWSAEVVGDRVIEELQGHRTLKKLIAILSHLTELHRHMAPEHSRAFTLQALTAIGLSETTKI